VVFPVGGIPDYAINGETAIAVPPKRPDLLSEALVDDGKRQLVALAGHRHIQQFTGNRATDQLENTFDVILQDLPSTMVP